MEIGRHSRFSQLEVELEKLWVEVNSDPLENAQEGQLPVGRVGCCDV